MQFYGTIDSEIDMTEEWFRLTNFRLSSGLSGNVLKQYFMFTQFTILSLKLRHTPDAF